MKTSSSALLVLGLGCLAAGGATGCSARSLLDLDLDVDTQELRAAGIEDPVDARLHVKVEQGDRNIREGTSERLSLAAPKVRAGFYLDDNTSGDVTVTITIVDDKDCRIGVQKKTITVKPGKATTINVTITITRPQCPSEPDAGNPAPDPMPGDKDAGDKDAGVPDSGTPGPDAAVEETASSDDAGDAGSDVYCPPETGVEVALPPTCAEFCAGAVAKCPQNYPRIDDCEDVCMSWKVGTVTTQTELDQNTLGCRALWLSSSNLGSQAAFRCQAAAVNSPFCTH